MKWRQGAAMAALALCAGGCVTGPNHQVPAIDMPASWHAEPRGGASAEPIADAAWWKALQDPVLDALVEQGIEANLDLKIAESRVREARAARGVAGAALFPTLGASGSYARTQSPELDTGGSPVTGNVSVGRGGVTRTVSVTGRNGSLSHSITNPGTGAGPTRSTSLMATPGAPGAPDRTTDMYQAGFDAAWELDLFGGNRRAVEAADATIDAADAARRATLVSLISEVALNYIELRAAQARLAITENNIAAQAETVDLTAARFAAGLSSELDTIRAEALLASTESQIPLLESRIAAARHRIAVLLGQMPGELDAVLGDAEALPHPPDHVPVGLPSELLRRRPDIQQAERELAAAAARVGVAEADLFPRFVLTGSLGGRSDALGSLLNGSNRIWSLGPSISWPIFEGGRIRANIGVQEARQEQAALAYEQAVLTALEEVENALVAYANEQTRLQALARSVEANEESVRLANERYVRGLEGFLNVLQAQQQLFQSEDAHVQSESFVLTQLIALYKALGGGWEEPNVSPDSAPVPAADVPAS